MADAERDRLVLTERIDRLEMDKKRLEVSNAAKIDENRGLLDQLENLNNNVLESDTKIRSLEANLLLSMQNVRRLESHAARAADAERHLALLEDEQAKLHTELRVTKDDARSHALRYREAQRGMTDMQDQLDRIEQENRLEKERHDEAIRRMEKQREVDKQLGVAAGRLKGAAASKSLQEQGKAGNSKIIGHFVRDLLQDNATLQLGIAELREMLMSSNDEIQTLREQLVCHQPVIEQDILSPTTSLRDELAGFEDAGARSMGGLTPSLSQELHIHHHYHVTPTKDAKRPKKKRVGLLPGIVTPTPSVSAPSSPGTSGNWGHLPPSPSAPSLSDVASSTRTSRNWADYQPSELSSSAPSSPNLRATSVFDATYHESADLLTSPATSYDPMSPAWRPARTKRASISSARSFQSLSCVDSDNDMVPPPLNIGAVGSNNGRHGEVIMEEDEDQAQTPDANHHPIQQLQLPTEDAESADELLMTSPRRRLHRAPSHESIMSLSGGLDIHTLRIRPSQMTLRPLGGVEAVLTGVIAQPTLSRSTSKRSDVALRDNFMGFQSPRTVSSPLARSSAMSSEPTSSPRSGLRSWAGWRPWGGTPSSSPGSAPTEPSTPQIPPRSSLRRAVLPEPETPTAKPESQNRIREWGRSPGINQPGAIPGFQQYWAAQRRKGAPAQVTSLVVDTEALNEGLAG